MKILVAGATGAIGLRLVRLFRASGHEVYGLTRSPARAGHLATLGAEPVVADALDRAALLRRLGAMKADAVIHQMTSLTKPPARHRDMRATDVLRTEGTTNLLAVAERIGARRFLTQSMVLGYGFGTHTHDPLTEAAPFGEPSGDAFDVHLAAMRSNEEQVFGAPLDGVALRYGLFYGVDPTAEAAALRRRRVPVSAGTSGALPWIHVDDAATATVAALENGRAGAAYNIVDDEPRTWTEMIEDAARRAGAPAPRRLPPWVLRVVAPYGAAVMTRTAMRVSNEKAKKDLDWTPMHAHVRPDM